MDALLVKLSSFEHVAISTLTSRLSSPSNITHANAHRGHISPVIASTAAVSELMHGVAHAAVNIAGEMMESNSSSNSLSTPSNCIAAVATVATVTANAAVVMATALNPSDGNITAQLSAVSSTHTTAGIVSEDASVTELLYSDNDDDDYVIPTEDELQSIPTYSGSGLTHRSNTRVRN